MVKITKDKKTNKSQKLFLELLKSLIPSKKGTVYRLYFIFIFISTFLYFAYSSILKIEGLWTRGHPLLNFYILNFELIKKTNIYVLVLILISLALFSFLYFKILLLKQFSIKKYITCILGMFLTAIFSINVAFIGVYLFSLGEIFIIEYKISQNPLANELIWDSSLIKEKLDNAVIIPDIVISENNINKQILFKIISEKKARSDFYRKIVFQEVLERRNVNLLIPNQSSIVMFQNDLYIRSFEGKSFEVISPTLGKLLVKNKMSSSNNKEFPTIEILTKEKYQKFRIQQINARIRKLMLLIETLNTVIEYQEDKMNQANGNINYYKGLANSSYAEGDSAFYRCSTAETCTSRYVRGYCGYYYCSSGYYVRDCKPTFSTWYCADLKSGYYEIGNQYMKTSNYWVEEYNGHLYLFNEFVQYKEEISISKNMAESSKESVPFELGLFQPENRIKIALSSTKPTMVADYISTLIHEYLHFDSYISEERSLPLFFEEGLTEHFSREVQKSGLDVDKYLGYPVLIRIIEQLIEKLPEQKLIEIYYSKDTNSLYELLDENYGEGFSEDNSFYFDILPYIPSQWALDFGNEMLEKLELPIIDKNEINTIPSIIKY